MRPTFEAALVRARFGAVNPYVFSATSAVPLAQQAAALFDAVSGALESAGGWLIEHLVSGASSSGFGRLMESRDRGELPWEAVCPFTPEDGAVPMLRGKTLDAKKPCSMMAWAGYPCWAAEGHVYSIDLLNAANELMLPYVDTDRRLWAVIPYGPHCKMQDRAWNAVLKAAMVALEADYAFGGMWVGLAATAYVWPDDLKQLDASTRLTELTHPHVILRTRDLPPNGMARLRKEVSHGSQKWTLPICEEFANGQYVFVSTTADYLNENFYLCRAVAKVLAKPYVGDKLVKPSLDPDA